MKTLEEQEFIQETLIKYIDNTFEDNNSGESMSIFKTDDIFNACHEIAEQFKPKWIPVTERLPEDGQEIIFISTNGKKKIGKYAWLTADIRNESAWIRILNTDNSYTDHRVKCWLPTPPETVK